MGRVYCAAMSPDDGAAAIEAAIGLRALGGSREALLRAAFDLVDTTPGMEVTRRSLAWGCPDPAVELCAAIAVTARGTIEALADQVAAIQARLTDGAPVLALDLLWARDPRGPTHVHPDVATRPSACGPLSEVAPDAKDPASGRYLTEHLYTAPPPYLESPRPFRGAFPATVEAIDGARLHRVEAYGRADLLAAAAEAFAGAPPSGEPIGPHSLRATATLPLAIEVAAGVADDERLLARLREVRAVASRDRLRVRRVVVLSDGDVVVRGLALGATVDARVDPGRPDRGAVSTTGGVWSADFAVAGATPPRS